MLLTVEFDTSSDPSLADINGNHIGVDVHTVISFASVDAESIGIDLQSGRQITAWIEYTDAAKLTQVWASDSQIRPSSPLWLGLTFLSISRSICMLLSLILTGKDQQLTLFIIGDLELFGLSLLLPLWIQLKKGIVFFCYPDFSRNNDKPSNLHERRAKIGDMSLGLGGLAAFVLSIIGVLVIIVFLVGVEKEEY